LVIPSSSGSRAIGWSWVRFPGGWKGWSFFAGVPSLFFPVDMRSKYNMVKTDRGKYSRNKWEDERLQGLRGPKFLATGLRIALQGQLCDLTTRHKFLSALTEKSVCFAF
jgi:hypothetical protein